MIIATVRRKAAPVAPTHLFRGGFLLNFGVYYATRAMPEAESAKVKDMTWEAGSSFWMELPHHFHHVLLLGLCVGHCRHKGTGPG